MNETAFKTALAEFTTKGAEELAMTDDLAELGVDSVGVFEFVMRVEDETGRQGIEIDESIVTVHDLYECVLESVE